MNKIISEVPMSVKQQKTKPISSDYLSWIVVPIRDGLRWILNYSTPEEEGQIRASLNAFSEQVSKMAKKC